MTSASDKYTTARASGISDLPPSGSMLPALSLTFEVLMVQFGWYLVRDRAGHFAGVVSVPVSSWAGEVEFRYAGQSKLHRVSELDWTRMSPELAGQRWNK